MVSGRPVLEWVMERQVVKTDKVRGIVNDANRYAVETVGNPAYPLELFQRIITVSLETIKIVHSLSQNWKCERLKMFSYPLCRKRTSFEAQW